MKTYVKHSLIIWLALTLLLFWLTTESTDVETAIVRVSLLSVPLFFMFYINLLWLSPKFLNNNNKRRYWLWIIAIVILHVVFFGHADYLVVKSQNWTLPHLDDRPIHMIYFGRLMASVPPFVISALIWKSYLLQKQKEESLELQSKMAEAENRALKAQINPHFLFNSMNNIYSLSQMKSDKTGDAILQLSEILRFVTYESEKDKVSLASELKQINNFIQLQMLKDDDQSNLDIHIEKDPDHLQIAPMLLLPFIENAFKHSNFEDKQKGWIKIDLHTEGTQLIMDISNSATLSPGKKDGIGGVGMENVKKRLSLIYSGKFKLNIKQDTNTYQVKLELDLS
ncbi:histidine kinase [Paracrocinitomix mangrovi]|uniref:sensor histidine kinase n=1 Tax=Paracrocinitomix mangrovi TaxID=2862509 RepID=UPI001C8E256B|nr:histidine kinase [Paracrocinitomix mangrovi]UKN03360.1 histidine kinase [Paracrocinitomix mangrovi]